MDSTITTSAMSASLLARNVYCVCFPLRDSLDSLQGDLAQVRKSFFSGGKKSVRVGKRETIRGFEGKLQGKLSRHGFYWRKTVLRVAGTKRLLLEEAFDQKGGYLLVTRDFQGIIKSRVFFDKSHLWIKSEYYEPWDNKTARVIFKPVEADHRVERFDWDNKNKRYRSTMLYPVPYWEGTAGQSLLNAKFGDPQFLVSTEEGVFCYCPQTEAQARQAAMKELQGGTVMLLPAWEIKEGALAQEEDEDLLGVSFTSLEEYAQYQSSEEQPAPVQEKEAKSQEQPTPAQEKEAKSQEQPTPAQEKEAEPQEQPTPTQEKEAKPQEQPTPTQEKEAKSQEQPAPTQEKEAKSYEQPAPAQEEKAKPQEQPAPAREEEAKSQEQTEGNSSSPMDPDGQAILQAARAAMKEKPSHPSSAPKEREMPELEPASQAILKAARKEQEKEIQDTSPSLPEALEVRQGTISGRGRTQHAGGLTTYEGEFRNGKRDGFGSYYFKDGNLCYAGFWKEDKKDGLGVSFRDSDHALHISRWKEGIPGEFVTLFDKDGNLRYSGRIENGKKQGAGISYNQEDGTIFVGKWQDGHPTGIGSAFDRDGNLVYYGAWDQGKRCGHGTEFDKNGGIVFDGEWRDGKYYNGILYQKLDREQEGSSGSTGPFWDL